MQRLWAGLGFGSGVIGALAVCAVLVVAGVYIQQGRNTEQSVAVQPSSSQNAENVPETQSIAAEDPKPAATSVTAGDTPLETAEIRAPAFDEVRREADGMTVIAGRGAPGAVVSILQNGKEIASSTVDSSGKFATLALIPPDGRGHSLTLSQTADGTAHASEGEILLAPLVAESPTPDTPASPVEIAEAPTIPAEIAPVSVTNGQAPAGPVKPSDTPDQVSTAGLTSGTDSQPQDPASEASGDSAREALVATSQIAPEVQDSTQKVAGATPLTNDTALFTKPVTVRNAASDVPQKPNTPAILRSTAEGVELLNPEAPEVMDNVALDIISYSDQGEVQLAGRAQADAASVRVYLDNSAKVDLPVDAEGRWRGDVPDIDEGIYTLRVDEVTSEGKVTSRVETPFKREAVEVLEAAAAAADGPIKAITVQKGATLWAIARDRYGSGELYVRVFEANKQAIRDPDLIYPGQIFTLPQ